MTQQMQYKENRIYQANSITSDLSTIFTKPATVTKRGCGKYYNISAAFDIETSSFMHNGEKVGIMYVWAFKMQDVIITGRTWEEFNILLDLLSDFLDLGPKLKLVIYVHNLAYEFQFMRKHIEWSENGLSENGFRGIKNDVFSIDERKPIRAVTANGIEFRCSYVLSGLSLAKTAENLTMHKIEKLKGDLDYSKLRHSQSEITETEWHYIYHDVMIVTDYIDECIVESGDITKIPMTNTGRVRRFCKSRCLPSNPELKFNRAAYRKLMRDLTIEPEEYDMLKKAFQGGFTHANMYSVGKIFNSVASFDFTSSYPAVILSEKFPMGKGEIIPSIKSLEHLEELCKCFCCIFTIKFKNIRPKVDYDNIISESKCETLVNPVVNNGRVMRADELTTTITNVDYQMYKRFYEWDSITIVKGYKYRKSYLPKEVIECVLELYKAKTELKGIKGFEAEYLLKKGMLNSIYGMMVTEILKGSLEYCDGWSVEEDVEEHVTSMAEKSAVKEESLNQYNRNQERFLYYPWGIFVTAYARYNLYTGILEFKNDYLYSDTDSLKVLNYKEHMEYIERYNEIVTKKIRDCLNYYNIDINEASPMNKEGERKPIGIWDFEGVYDTFKTLGAKRYMVKKFDKKLNKKILEITIAGVSKSKGSEYLMNRKIQKQKPFYAFSNNLIFPGEYTGKQTHTYIDEVRSGYVPDYNGKYAYFEEESSIHLEACDYLMATDKFEEFIRLNIQNKIGG